MNIAKQLADSFTSNRDKNTGCSCMGLECGDRSCSIWWDMFLSLDPEIITDLFAVYRDYQDNKKREESGTLKEKLKSKFDNLKKIKEQAIRLIKEQKEVEPNIKSAYWFPHNKEVRLVALEDDIPPSLDRELEPFYFSKSDKDGLLFPTAYCLIRTDEYHRLILPEGWGDWSQGVEI